jgi:glycosyltransferase involved in cell wall biosynthesis
LKILLAQNASYYPTLGGANKSNRVLLEALCERGHECRVVSTALANNTSEQISKQAEQVKVISSSPYLSIFECKGVNVHAVKVKATMDNTKLKEHFIEQIKEFDPTWILISTEDIGQILLEAAIKIAPSRVIYLARTTLYLSFGPDCFLNLPAKTELLQKAGGIIAVGDYIKEYLRKWGNLDSEVLPISLFGTGPFHDYGNFKGGYVTMINPCAFKGISIFLSLAELYPEIEFAAVPTWGTTTEDMKALSKLKNVHILEPVDDMNKIYSITKIMIVPSLWAEAKSRTIVEAMLHGIPVLASNVGGNPEAKLGVEYTLPVNPIKEYKQICDERSLPISEVPPQDIKPWKEALDRLLQDNNHYVDISKRSRKAALEYIENRGGPERVEKYLLDLSFKEKKQEIDAKVLEIAESNLASITDKLTPIQKKLLALRLNKKMLSQEVSNK